MKNKISYKLILAVGSAIVAIIVIFSFVIINSQQKAMIAQIRHNANQLSETVKSSTKYDMLLNRREDLHRIIDSIGEQDGIEKVRIFNKEGQIIYSSSKDEINFMVDKQAESCDVCHASEEPPKGLTIPERTRIFENQQGVKNLGIINPIYNEPSCWQADCHAHDAKQEILGVLDVTMSLEEVDTEIRANTGKMVLLAVSSIFAISLISWFFVHKLIGKPVSKLVHATNMLAAGNLDYRIKNGKDDELGHLENSFNDMTEKLAEAQRQLYQSDKLASLGRLAAGVAHEINNPLTGVLTYSSFLLKRLQDQDETKEDIEVIVRETKRCRDIVKGLLDFARQVPAKKTNVAVNDVVNRAVSILENELNLKSITVRKTLSDALPTIEADANQLQQVLINLLVNASDAIGDAGGRIDIVTQTLQFNGETVIAIKISDTGCGIAQENLSKIFEPFYSTKGQKGTGLGLAVAWGIIEKHGGDIHVESVEGQGTTFAIHLQAKRGSTKLIEKEYEYAV